MARKETMFDEFVERIALAENKEEAIDKVYFGKGGIFEAANSGELTFRETMILKELIRKMA